MSGGQAFSGAPRSGGTRDRLVAGFVIVALIGFLGIAVVKPWAGPAEREPTPGPSTARSGLPSPSFQPTPSNVSRPSPSATPGPLPLAFSMPAPPPASASWAALRWRRLAPDDPLRLVTSVLRWRDVFIAAGAFGAFPATPVWTSSDGGEWVPLPAGTSTSFWPGLGILGIARLPTDLVALTAAAGPCGGSCAPGSPTPVVAWTSDDGRSWAPHTLPADWQASAAEGAPILAVGPAGSVVASSGPNARLAMSSDGRRWRSLPADAFPSQFVLDDLAGTAAGYVAIGRWMSGGRSRAVSLWSPDARRWSRTPTVLPPSDTGVRPTATHLLTAGDAFIGVGREAARPRRVVWWRSADGRRWEELRTYGPLGATTCVGEGCGPGPAGIVLGDGRRFVALRGGSQAAAWESTDGRSWRSLAMTGDVPTGSANPAILMPGGILMTDGSTTWFGEAIAR